MGKNTKKNRRQKRKESSQTSAEVSNETINPNFQQIGFTETPDEPMPSTSGAPQQSPQVDNSKLDSKKLAIDLTKEKFIEKSIIKRKFPKRPDYLTIGEPLLLTTNHYLLSVGSKKAYHYDIQIDKVPNTSTKKLNVVDKVVEEKNKNFQKTTKFARKLATKLNRKVFQQMIEEYSKSGEVFEGINPVYDGQKNMFTSKELFGTENGDHLILEVVLDEQGMHSSFNVSIKLAKTNQVIDLNKLNEYHSGVTSDDEVVKKCILFIDTLIRHNMTMSWVPIGQSIFDPNVQRNSLNQFIYYSLGFYTTVRNLMAGTTLVMDQSTSVFYNEEEDNMIPMFESIAKGIYTGNKEGHSVEWNPNDYQKLRSKLKQLINLRVEAIHNRFGTSFRKYNILGVSRKSAKAITFHWMEKTSDGKTTDKGFVSVDEYFLLKYNIKLEYPQYPCLRVGNPNNFVNLPIEVCRLVSHQRLKRPLTILERSELTKKSGQQTPKQRFDSVEELSDELFHSGELADKNKTFLSEFGIDINKELMIVESKVIEPPKLKFLGLKDKIFHTVLTSNGAWQMNTEEVMLLKPARLEKWIVISLSFEKSFRNHIINYFVNELMKQSVEMGMTAEQPLKKLCYQEFTLKTFDNIKFNLNHKYPETKMILFITPDKGHEYSNEIYSAIKLLGDVEGVNYGGLATQCVNINKIWFSKRKTWNRSYLKQLLLKINIKLGGINWKLDKQSMPQIMKEESIMIVGADVNHPAPADAISSSIAAMVGTYDKDFVEYFATISMQPKSREEMIINLDQMTIDLLECYKKKNNELPQRIIFYRDGVSEGQFQQVIDKEYPLLTKAFSEVDPTFKPKLTFIVVQKRHHTRFMTDRKQNMPPGTVVDKDVTHKNDFDFYLCSHAGRIGTSRSAHYYVLADENGFSSDDMCKMTYYLCHTFQRSTSSVSIPAPVYYADLAAYRAKVHASGYSMYSNDNSSVTTEDSSDTIQKMKEMIDVINDQKDKLYFI